MTAQELYAIKEYQKDFESRFGSKLEIDFPAMKGMTKPIELDLDMEYTTPEQILKECLKKHKANINLIRDKTIKISRSKYKNENNFLKEYSRLILSLRNQTMYSEIGTCTVTKAAELINKDRTNLYHYAGTKRRDKRKQNLVK